MTGVSLVRLGGAQFILGLAAWMELFLTGLAAVHVVVVLMALAGLVQFAHSLWLRRGLSRFLWSAQSLFYLASAGCFLLAPFFAAQHSGLYLAILLGLSGLIGLGMAKAKNQRATCWMKVSSLFSIAAAQVAAASWTFQAFSIATILLSIDMLLRGSMLMLTGCTLHDDRVAEPETMRR